MSDEEPPLRPLLTSLCSPRLLPDPLRRLGSRAQLSERPMPWPKLLSESLFSFPMFEDVLRFTSPAGVDDVFLLILSRSRFSIHCLLRCRDRLRDQQLFRVQWECPCQRISKMTETV